ncbi:MULTISPECIES: hypothetical protein [unclassified Streptosporangium]|nr:MULTISPECIES: hypothetical protein [unclassified Streptosporangium]
MIRAASTTAGSAYGQVTFLRISPRRAPRVAAGLAQLAGHPPYGLTVA